MTSEPSQTDNNESFPTDTEISSESATEERLPPRKLQKWSETTSNTESGKLASPVRIYMSLDEQSRSTNNEWTPQAMFEHHEKKYNFKSTYDELEYTTPLPVASDDQLLKATRMENEILREGQHDEEDYERSEEDLFSKVLRPGNKQNYYRGGSQKQKNRKEFDRKPDKKNIHPEALDLPEWRQTAFTKLKNNQSESTIQHVKQPKCEDKPEKFDTPVSEEISDNSIEVENQLNRTQFDVVDIAPSAGRNKTSIQKKKDAIEYIESHSREEIKQNFISFSHDLTPRISTIAKIPQESTNSNADLTSNSYHNLEIFLASKSVPNLESNSIKGEVTIENNNMTSSSIGVSEDWESETADKFALESASEQSSIQSQLTPIHTHTHSHDSQDSGVLDSEYPPSTESDNYNHTDNDLYKQGSSTLNPQAEEFRFDMSKLSDVILQDPAYIRSMRKGGSQKYAKQPNASMRGRGNSVVPSQRSGTGTSSAPPTFSKKPEIPSPGSGGKGKGYTESIVGPTGYSTQKRGNRKSGRYKSLKHQGYKPNYEMEQQLYTLPGSQFQVLANPNGVFYQPSGLMTHIQQSSKPGPIPQPLQMSTHHNTQIPNIQPLQAMQNPQLAMQQVSYPRFPLSSQMPEDPQSLIPPQGTQILIGPDGIPISLPPTQSDYQPYPQQSPHGYAQLQPTESPQQYILPQYIPGNSAPHQHGYIPMESQLNQVLYSQYPPQGIIQLQNNPKSNLY
ncbi:PAB1-binding protein 1 [Oopsacas minuta]|uniref:PAB1-binding protein 1 n=1 Tax=Oopsacas minuta TaxID=111878 RepID=A0AAV7JFQ1_9METZ|nr:PAB1-binding protein 1 [Oopsacas minuta]